MSKKTNTQDQESIQDSSSKIEAIKNLIFGENIQQYDSEFEDLKKVIDKQKAALETYIEEIRGELMQAIDSLSTDVNIRITDLEDSMNEKTETLTKQKVDKKELSKMLISLGEKIGA
ncbi:fructose 1,6-bisphosphatase [Patiriisocius marinus]|uniref:fructose 1,6-bisphosphatase n=1 Tax=Patiriisocius marinus TaxID=1397112 RepID=UPI0023300FFF|nr:fructose 1,6-bisphosphatase [Patiriisocius marinus]